MRADVVDDEPGIEESDILKFEIPCNKYSIENTGYLGAKFKVCTSHPASALAGWPAQGAGREAAERLIWQSFDTRPLKQREARL